MLSTKGYNIIEALSRMAAIECDSRWWVSKTSSRNRFHKIYQEVLNEAEPHLLGLKKIVILSLLNLIRSFKFIFVESYNIARIRLIFHYKHAQAQNLGRAVIIKSFAYNSSVHHSSYTDPFFKDLSGYLQKLGYNILTVVDNMGDHERLAQTKQSVLPYQVFLTPLSPFISFFKLVHFKIKVMLNRKKHNFDTSLYKFLYQLFTIDIISPESINDLMFEDVGVSVGLNFNNAHRHVLTYENNGWEKMYAKGIKKVSSTPIYAYQHAVIPETSLNMFLGTEENLLLTELDLVFTTGTFAQDLLKKYSKITPQKLQVSGTTRFRYLHELRADQQTSLYEYLIALEGVIDAAEVINRFIENCTVRNKRPRTLIRFHPSLGLQKIKKHLKYNLKEYSYLEISESSSVIEDILNADATIYWGSTCSLEAIMLKKPIIHFSSNSALSYDPLWNMPCYKQIWSAELNVLDLKDKINHDESQIAIDYVKGFFEDLKIDVIDKYFLE